MRLGRPLAASVALGAALTCGSEGSGPTSPPEETSLSIEVASGDGQVAPVGTSLERFLVARVDDAASRPVEGVQVRWVVVEGAGELSVKRHRTDAQGLSSAVLFLGDEPGDQLVRASIEGDAAAFTARGVAPEQPL